VIAAISREVNAVLAIGTGGGSGGSGTISRGSGDLSSEVNQNDLHDESEALHMAETLKVMLDKEFGAHWHCIVGRDFGSLITHQQQRFVYFTRAAWSYMIFKIG
jgi:hypothetical protein